MLETDTVTTPSNVKPRRRRNFALYLDSDIVARVDLRAKAAKLSRSWVFERVLEGWLDDQDAKEAANG